MGAFKQVSDCEAACISTSWCNSFDYYKRDNACDLSGVSSQDVERGLKRDYAGDPYDHYDCTGHCTVTRNAAISGHNRQHLSRQTVSTVRQLAKEHHGASHLIGTNATT